MMMMMTMMMMVRAVDGRRRKPRRMIDELSGLSRGVLTRGDRATSWSIP